MYGRLGVFLVGAGGAGAGYLETVGSGAVAGRDGGVGVGRAGA